ncbi:MAG TPA: glycosyltransferase, partial [Flavisolibacter sp.]|nr:glycosyltransferase [Flavisolibacter sp.]
MPDSITGFAIITPCFNEGEGILDFLRQLEESINTTSTAFTVIVVDDCSEDDTLEKLRSFQFSDTRHRLMILTLQFNIGHQAAIYQGLLYASTLKMDRVIIMDADGEDDPQAIPDLMKHTDYSIVEVKRGKREDGLLF